MTLSRPMPINKKQLPVEIPDMVDFLLDNGILFELNRCIFHPIGLAMMVQQNDEGENELGLFDYSDKPTLTFDVATYQRGREKWLHWLRTKGYGVSHNRKRLLGITVQTQPDYREQLKTA